MAGLGQHIVGNGLMRLAGLLNPRHKAKSHALSFRPAPLITSDPKAIARAHNLYAGTEQLSAEQFLSLEWLSCFARSGRQLLMCHALNLLEGWNTDATPAGSIDVEAQVLNDITTSAAFFAANLNPEQLAPLTRTFDTQLKRLLHIKTRTPHDQLKKAFALLAAARAVKDQTSIQHDALRLLDHALPQLIASDGGPLAHSLQDYVQWVSPLLLEQDITFSVTSRTALDRARPFLAMLLDAGKNYTVPRAPVPVADVLSTAALRLATTSLIARLASAKTVAIALPSQLADNTSLDISAHAQKLLTASLFLHDGHEDQSVTSLSNTESEQGQLLIQETRGTSRMVFLSTKGDDLRIEDQWPQDDLKRWMRLDVNPGAKVSIARNGTQATIAIDSRNIWQLTIRGAKLLSPREDGLLIAETRSDRINWALKRMARTVARTEKQEELELPF